MELDRQAEREMSIYLWAFFFCMTDGVAEHVVASIARSGTDRNPAEYQSGQLFPALRMIGEGARPCLTRRPRIELLPTALRHHRGAIIIQWSIRHRLNNNQIKSYHNYNNQIK